MSTVHMQYEITINWHGALNCAQSLEREGVIA